MLVRASVGAPPCCTIGASHLETFDSTEPVGHAFLPISAHLTLIVTAGLLDMVAIFGTRRDVRIRPA